MFDDRNGRRIKFGGKFKGRIRIIDIVIGKRLTLKLARIGHARTIRTIAVKRGLLMRVFAITQGIYADAGKAGAFWQAGVIRCHPVGNCTVIGGGAGKGGRRQFLTKHKAGTTLLGDFRTGRFIIGWITDNGYKRMVLGGRTDHRRSANIDIFDQFITVIGAL